MCCGDRDGLSLSHFLPCGGLASARPSHFFYQEDNMAQLTALTGTTELQAANQILAAVGEAPVDQTEYDTPTQNDTTMLVNVLQATAREVLSMGWRCNTEFGYELAPEVSSYDWVDSDGVTTTLNIFTPPTGMIVGEITPISAQQGTSFPDTELRHSRLFRADAVLVNGTLAIGTDTAKFQTTTASAVRLGGDVASFVAEDDIAFSAAYTINAGDHPGTWFGSFLVQATAAGVISTKAVSTNQMFSTAALAEAQLPGPDADNVTLGYITIECLTGQDWDATVDDLTDASDCTTCVYTDATAVTADTPVVVFYDRANNRDGFDEDDRDYLYLDIVWYLKWDAMPEVLKRYITVRTARRYVNQLVGDRELVQFSKEDELLALRNLKREQGEEDDYNLIYDDASRFRHLGGRPIKHFGVMEDRDNAGPA